jgi:hypothetical protein
MVPRHLGVTCSSYMYLARVAFIKTNFKTWDTMLKIL